MKKFIKYAHNSFFLLPKYLTCLFVVWIAFLSSVFYTLSIWIDSILIALTYICSLVAACIIWLRLYQTINYKVSFWREYIQKITLKISPTL